jgi:hypothetical protein
MAEEAIDVASEFEGELPIPTDVARANIISGILYMTIADNFEDFTFSNRTEVGPPVGEANMNTVYDIALERFATAESVAAANGATGMVLAAKAFQARTHWAKALWSKLNPPGSAPADPLVNDAQANALAAEVIAEIGATDDWKWQFTYSPATQTNAAAGWVNSRQEFVVDAKWADLDAAGRSVEEVTYPDPVDGTVDPALDAIVTEFVELFQHPPLTVMSARELHLILAEAALAEGNEAEAVTHINHVREIKGSTPYDPAVHDVGLQDLLVHERVVNMFLQPGRRLLDQYRFDIPARQWAPGSDAQRNGQVFIIGQDERVSNCYLLGTC